MVTAGCRIALVSILALAVMEGPAIADGSCSDERVWKDYLVRNLEQTPAARFHFVDEPAKSVLVARFNDVDPPTAFAPERVGFFGVAATTDGSSESPRGPASNMPPSQMAVLVFISDGCIDYAGPVPVERLEEMLRPPG